jgi:alpha-aminoadipate carrier protein LysW
MPVLCPECESDIDVEEDELEEGAIVSCPECGTDLEVVTASPLHLQPVSDEEDEEQAEEEGEDGDY